MKRYLSLLFSIFTILILSQKREMSEYFSTGQYDMAIQIGKDILKSNPDDFDAIIIIARSEMKKGISKMLILILKKQKN